jgi:maltooligosyltrehalose trehalohydrolase
MSPPTDTPPHPFPPVGAFPGDGGTTFTVWAPNEPVVLLHLLDTESQPDVVKLEERGDGYFTTTCPEVEAGARYRYRLSSGEEYADPASRAQPEGHLGPSQVVDLGQHTWRDDGYRAKRLSEHVISEVHLGAFTPGGTLDDAMGEIDSLAAAGISAVELMPVAEFPGRRNWGYDGVFPFAVQHSYGGWSGLQRFVDACHQRGVAVILDVVYNHVGPEGSVFAAFGPYFTDRYRTPWGPAINFDGPASDHVRAYFLQNARQWFVDFHLDGLRLDAVHEIIDRTATPFLLELARETRTLSRRCGRPLSLIAESPDNDPRLIMAEESNGLGLAALWNDDFHHALHVAVTGERTGYYADYSGLTDVVTALTDGFVFQGQYSPFRDRHHGAVPRGVLAERLVNFAQNHDQIGNRARGDRLVTMVPFEVARLVAATLLLSPGVPLLFMGEEYGETAPFPYFVDHHDPHLLQAVREGRAAEFASLADAGQLYDPGAPESFAAARLDRSLRDQGHHQQQLSLTSALIDLRRRHPALGSSALNSTVARDAQGLLTVVRTHPTEDALLFLNFTAEESVTELPAATDNEWSLLLSSRSAPFGGVEPTDPDPTQPHATVTIEPWGFAVYQKSRPSQEPA